VPTQKPTEQPVVDDFAAAGQQQQQQQPLGEANVTPQPEVPEDGFVTKEEQVEYRDQDGNILDLDQVKELEGKVSFKTRYETRTRLVDAYGNEIVESVVPPLPEAVNPETVQADVENDREEPSENTAVEADEAKEESVEENKSRTGEAKPASEGNVATD
jgi:dolichyl-phosphate-mannose-protein mannosyltransferase